MCSIPKKGSLEATLRIPRFALRYAVRTCYAVCADFFSGMEPRFRCFLDLQSKLDIRPNNKKNNTIFLSDYKSYLQELVQTDQRSVEYRVVSETGPAHDKEFEVEVLVDNIVFAHGKGKSKKAAEQNAAKNAIELSAGGKQ